MMLAYRLLNKEEMDLTEIRSPEPGDGEIVCKTISVSVCATDYQYYAGISSPPELPIILGHEYFGEICENRSQYEILSPGTRIVYWGQTDFFGMAEFRKIRPVMSESRNDETFATDRNFFDDHRAACSVVPMSFNFGYPSLAEPLAAVMRSIYWNPPRPGDNILILGGGSCGLLSLPVFRALGCGALTVIEKSAHRRALSRVLGAQKGLSPAEFRDCTDASSQSDLSDQVDYVFDALPTQSDRTPCETRDIALRAARPQAKYVLFGANSKRQPIDLWSMLAKGISMVSAPFDVRSFPMWRTAAVLDASLRMLEANGSTIAKLAADPVSFGDEKGVLGIFSGFNENDSPKSIVTF